MVCRNRAMRTGRANRISGTEDEWDEEAVVEHAYFNGKVSITGGTVSADLMGSSRDDALEGNKPGTIEFGGGTVNVRNTPVRAGKIEFADDVRVKGVTADKREERCKEGEALTVEVCPHDNLSYTDVDDDSHSVECRECLTSLGKTEEHTYGEPVWNWDESGTAANATFTCVKCGHTDVREAEVEQTEPEQQTEPKLQSISAGGRLRSEATVTIDDVTFTDEKDKDEYDIVLDDMENGSVEAQATAKVDSTVTLSVTPDEHYHIGSVSVNGEALAVKDGSCSFKMPKGNVKVTAVFEIDTVKLTWISRDYVYDYEKDEYTDETVDTVVYEEQVPYGTEGPLPSAEEFAALYGYCGLDKWEVEKNGKTVEMKPGESAVADSDVALTAIWREHDFRYSISEDGATITASCSHEDWALTDGKISLTIRRPAVNTYGDTEKGLEANASLTLDGLDAFIEYARNLQAFMEYGEGMDASEEYAEITEYYKAHPEEYAEYAEEIDAYLKYLEDCAAVIDGWADKYIKYYRAEKDSEGVYVKTGSALEAAPTEAGDYVAELVADPEIFGSDTKIFVGYTIGKADPL
jgi:hypothetical protein